MFQAARKHLKAIATIGVASTLVAAAQLPERKGRDRGRFRRAAGQRRRPRDPAAELPRLGGSAAVENARRGARFTVELPPAAQEDAQSPG
jgi:hypothetical protein